MYFKSIPNHFLLNNFPKNLNKEQKTRPHKPKLANIFTITCNLDTPNLEK